MTEEAILEKIKGSLQVKVNFNLNDPFRHELDLLLDWGDASPCDVAVFQEGIHPLTGMKIRNELKRAGISVRTLAGLRLADYEESRLVFRLLSENGKEIGTIWERTLAELSGGAYKIRNAPFLSWKVSRAPQGWTKLTLNSNCFRRLSGHIWVEMKRGSGKCFHSLPPLEAGNRSAFYYFPDSINRIILDDPRNSKVRITREN